MKATLRNIKYLKNPDVMDAINLSRDIENVYYSSRSGELHFSYYNNHSDELTAAATPEVIRESLMNCEARLTAIQEEAAKKSQSSPATQVSPYSNSPQASPFPPSGSMPPSTSMPVYSSTGGGMYMGGGMSGGFGFFGMGLAGMIVQVANTEIFRTIKTAKPEDIKAQSDALLSAARYCHGRLNLLGKTNSKNPLDCTEAPEIVNYKIQNFARDFVSKLAAKEPEQLMAEVLFGIQGMVEQDVLDVLQQNAPPAPIATPEPQMKPYGRSGAYCPNRTAELIESILQDNPCVSRAYVPTDFLAKTLSQRDPRVAFRKFEKNDRYAIEVGGGKCTPVVK